MAKDEGTGAVLAYDCFAKGPRDDWVVKQLVRDLADCGRRGVRLQTASPPCLHSSMRAAQLSCYNPQSNGGAEKAVQDVTDLMRRMPVFEGKVRSRLDLTLPWSRWLVRHAAFVLTRYQVGHDGLTPWRTLTGRAWNSHVFHFGEKVMGRLVLKKPSIDRTDSRGKTKLASRSLPSVWLGVYPRTGEHIVALESGEAIRVRTVHRLPEADRWSADAMLAVRALPRKPHPKSADNETAPRMNTEYGEEDGDRADGADLGAAAVEDRFGGLRNAAHGLTLRQVRPHGMLRRVCAQAGRLLRPPATFRCVQEAHLREHAERPS